MLGAAAHPRIAAIERLLSMRAIRMRRAFGIGLRINWSRVTIFLWPYPTRSRSEHPDHRAWGWGGDFVVDGTSHRHVLGCDCVLVALTPTIEKLQ